MPKKTIDKISTVMYKIVVPSPGESVLTVMLAEWLVKDGDYVEKNSDIAEIDSDKATLTISAEEEGVIKILVQEGENVDVGAVIAKIDPQGKPNTNKVKRIKENDKKKLKYTPLAKAYMKQENLSEKDVIDMLRDHKIKKADIENLSVQSENIEDTSDTSCFVEERSESRKKMTPLRVKLSQRLVGVKNETAMLTTFNEVNMKEIMDLRTRYAETFEDKHGVKLGFMAFFAKAVSIALLETPEVNAFIDGNDIVYHNYVDISIAVSSPKGLVVPVIRNVNKLSLAETEAEIKLVAEKAKEGKLSLEDMSGGTFTISNGGVFGSMLSTPIINPPQSAILGMHNIVERPVVVDKEIVIRPIMYLALSYDHRIVDGKESVGFLVRVKELIENPALMVVKNDPLKKLLDI